MLNMEHNSGKNAKMSNITSTTITTTTNTNTATAIENYDVIPCSYCKRKFTSVKGMLSHLQVNKASFSCDKCSIVFTNQCAFKYHILVCMKHNNNNNNNNNNRVNTVDKEEFTVCKLNLPTNVTCENDHFSNNLNSSADNITNQAKRLKSDKFQCVNKITIGEHRNKNIGNKYLFL